MPVDAGLDYSHLLAEQYREAVRELALHWPDTEGDCLGCGDAYPCAQEWITMRAITGIETRWRREATRLDAIRRLENPAAGVAAHKHETE